MTGEVLEYAAEESVILPRTITVDFAIMSSSDSRSKVAPVSGKLQDDSNSAMKRKRFTPSKRAVRIPTNLSDITRVIYRYTSEVGFAGHAVGATCPIFPEMCPPIHPPFGGYPALPGLTISI